MLVNVKATSDLKSFTHMLNLPTHPKQQQGLRYFTSAKRKKGSKKKLCYFGRVKYHTNRTNTQQGATTAGDQKARTSSQMAHVIAHRRAT